MLSNQSLMNKRKELVFLHGNREAELTDWQLIMIPYMTEK